MLLDLSQHRLLGNLKLNRHLAAPRPVHSTLPLVPHARGPPWHHLPLIHAPSVRLQPETDPRHLRARTLHNSLGFCLGLMRLGDLLLRCGERPACVNPRHSIQLFEEQLSLRNVKVPHDRLQSTALVLIHGHLLCNGISDESLGTPGLKGLCSATPV